MPPNITLNVLVNCDLRVIIEAVDVDDRRKRVGYLEVWKYEMSPRADEKPAVSNVYVDEDYQRRGIATAMYDRAEEVLGEKLSPSPRQYPDAVAFWAARNSDGTP